MVLVDSSHPEQYARLPQGRENYERSKQLFAAPLLARVGVIRHSSSIRRPELLPQQRAQIAAFNSSTRQVSATTEEFRATPKQRLLRWVVREALVTNRWRCQRRQASARLAQITRRTCRPLIRQHTAWSKVLRIHRWWTIGVTRKRPVRPSLRLCSPCETIGRSHGRSQPRDTRMRACDHENPMASTNGEHPWATLH